MRYFFLFLALLGYSFSSGQNSDYWTLRDQKSIIWELEKKSPLPHADNIEMAGKRVAGIISYSVDTAGILSLERQIFFPQLHPYIKSSDPDWYIYRAYLKDIYDDDILPVLVVDEKVFVPGKLESVTIDGHLNFSHHPAKSGLQLERKLYPSMSERLFVEEWILKNTSDRELSLRAGNSHLKYVDYGQKGKFTQTVLSDAPEKILLASGASFSFSIKIMAQLNDEQLPVKNNARAERSHFLKEMSEALILDTPDPVLNTLFEFSKIRASESIFESEMGLIHSPGGGRYYAGFWANDQAEYVSPLFPYLAYETGIESAMNCYNAFAGETNPRYKKIRYAFEIEGLVSPFLLDRGDAAMIAYGASHFALANGDRETAEALWPLIQWCLEYCNRQLNEEGVVKSESDEMEGRIETGDANLSTSSLYYGALMHSIDLAKALKKPKSVSRTYIAQQEALHLAIEKYFGAKVEGLDTYKYYKTHQKLRHWICLPLVVGIHERVDATVEALFDRLWTDNGVYVEKNSDNEANSKIFWDRGTLYALRGTFFAGATEVSLKRLQQYSRQRLLGKRVPYAVEAYPEGSMAHLSAESGLYCRVFTEGMFGIVPKGFNRFTCCPRLPEKWDHMALRKIRAFGSNFDLEVQRKGQQQLEVRIKNSQGKVMDRKVLQSGEVVEFRVDQ